jgi:cytidyltransferase-like protein
VTTTSPRLDLACVHGRFQPFHLGHWSYLQEALALAERVVVGITCPFLLPELVEEQTDNLRHLPDNNPFTYFERTEMISTTLGAGPQRRVLVVPFDVNGPAHLWPQVVPLHAVQVVTPHEPWDDEKAARFHDAGYATLTLPTRVDRITATEVRKRIAHSLPWRHLVPPGTAAVIDKYDLASRLAGNRSAEVT